MVERRSDQPRLSAIMRAARDKTLTSVRATAIRMLARRDYPRAEMAQRLASRGADPDEVTGVLDELEKLGYLSDSRYAQALVAQKIGRYGRRAIAHALAQRRLSASAVRNALETLDGVDELADAATLRERRFPDAPKDERERARQVRFLMARGYAMSVALRVVGRACGTAADAEPD